MRGTIRGIGGVATAILVGIVGTNCGSDTTGVGAPIYTATLSGANERPTAVTSPGTGTATFVDNGTSIDWTLTFDGLTNMTVSHIHGPADATVAAPVMINLFLPLGNTGAAKPITAHGQFTNNANQAVSLDSLRVLFNTGKSYANVHTTANPGGEIRGQIARSN